ncbi:unnamed protein product [Closterium sp. NIES-64]|nr:unnamed protein product [Closterium sp. NIES-64]
MRLCLQVWQIFVGTKARRRAGLYDALLEEAHREDDLCPNSTLADIYARIRAKDVHNSWAVQIEKVREGENWGRGGCVLVAHVSDQHAHKKFSTGGPWIEKQGLVSGWRAREGGEDDMCPNSSLADMIIYTRSRRRRDQLVGRADLFCLRRLKSLLLSRGYSWAVQIEKDLPRTFPGHPALDSIGRDSLRRLLTAYARKNKDVGYCQVRVG